MLVLTRKELESIVIGGDITVTVLSINSNRVRIGISAPVAIRVDRKEVNEQRQAKGEEK